jgi:hypothetical protein
MLVLKRYGNEKDDKDCFPPKNALFAINIRMLPN